MEKSKLPKIKWKFINFKYFLKIRAKAFDFDCILKKNIILEISNSIFRKLYFYIRFKCLNLIILKKLFTLFY